MKTKRKRYVTGTVHIKPCKRRKYPFKAVEISFKLINDGSACDAMKMLMAYMGIGAHQYWIKEMK